MSRLLLIEDDPAIRHSLVKAMTERGHTVISEPAGMPGLQRATTETLDAIILDLGLPDIDGMNLLKMLRGVSTVPVIVVTAREEESGLVKALDAGADDYVTKPFSADRLEARLRAVLRRSQLTDEPTILEVGALRIDLSGRVVTLEGSALELTPKEFDVLAYLAQRPGQVATKSELMSEIWQAHYGGADRTVDVHVSWLRRKLGESAQDARYLHTVRGVGVKLVNPNHDAGTAT